MYPPGFVLSNGRLSYFACRQRPRRFPGLELLIKLACPNGHPLAVDDLEPRSFSFNSPYGACPECSGLGIRKEVDPDLVVPDPSKSLGEGAIAPWAGSMSNEYFTRLLSGLADRYPRLAVMVACDLLRVPVVLALCRTTLPLWVVFMLIAVLGALGPPFDSARSALQPDVLEGEAYVVGNALMNVCVQISQILGFVVGGGSGFVRLPSAAVAAVPAGTVRRSGWRSW